MILEQQMRATLPLGVVLGLSVAFACQSRVDPVEDKRFYCFKRPLPDGLRPCFPVKVQRADYYHVRDEAFCTTTNGSRRVTSAANSSEELWLYDRLTSECFLTMEECSDKSQDRCRIFLISAAPDIRQAA